MTEPLQGADPVLQGGVSPNPRPSGRGEVNRMYFPGRLQGDHQTVFLDV